MKRVILNTRPADSGGEFDRILEKENFDVISFPLIEIVPAGNYEEIDERLEKINDYDGLIFTSGNAVGIFLKRAAERKTKITCSIFAVGEKTGEKIEEFGYACEQLPDKADSESLAEMIAEKKGGNKKYLFPKGRIGMNRIPEYLPGVDGITVYDTVMPDTLSGIDNVRNLLNNKEVDCIVFFSPSAVKNFFVLFPEYRQGKTAVAAIGETTKKKAESTGLKVDILPGRYLSEELAKEIIKYFNE